MTRRDLFRCLNEPFADPYFYGPEARSEREKVNGKNVVAHGYEDCTFASRVALIERENVTEEVEMIYSTCGRRLLWFTKRANPMFLSELLLLHHIYHPADLNLICTLGETCLLQGLGSTAFHA